MARAGTFDYVAVVPADVDAPAGGGCPDWPVALRAPIEPTGSALRDDRLVGYAPRLRIEDTPPTPAGPHAGPGPYPPVLRSRITLTASDRQHAGRRAVHFHVARGLTTALRLGDVLHLRRNQRASLGLSALRAGRLVVAVGAVHVMPLGDDVAVRGPGDEPQPRLRPGAHGPRRGEVPVEVRVGGRWHPCGPGDTDLGAYAVHVVRGFTPDNLFLDACAAIARTDACPAAAAAASAQLLALDDLVMDP